MAQLKSICEELRQKYPDNAFEPFVDSSPIDEVDMAVKAGLGIKGKNSLLITEKWGSFVFIGEIVTDLQLPATLYEEKGCLNCGICVQKCPGGAISCGDVQRGRIDKEKCASFISQKKQQLSDEQTDILKRAKTVFGCDICQNVCPHNRKVLNGEGETAGSKNLFSDDVLKVVTKENVAAVYKERPFGFRGLKVLERNLEIFGQS